MCATQLLALLAVAAARGADAHGFLRTRAGRSAVSPEDMAHCVKYAARFMDEPMRKALAIERATDHCAVDKKIDDRNYFCPHFKEGLTGAFLHESESKEFTAASFCEVSENHMLQLRGATRVPNMGSGPLMNFKLSASCEQTTLQALAPARKLPSSQVPDFWYALCMNQDCAHFLPSRTRWCDVDRQPTHSAIVCEGVRDFAKDEVAVDMSHDMEPKEICHMYAEFIEEIGIDVESFEHVVHSDQPDYVPVPSDPDRALGSSRQVNAAAKHDLRDNAGEPVE